MSTKFGKSNPPLELGSSKVAIFSFGLCLLHIKELSQPFSFFTTPLENKIGIIWI